MVSNQGTGRGSERDIMRVEVADGGHKRDDEGMNTGAKCIVVVLVMNIAGCHPHTFKCLSCNTRTHSSCGNAA